MLLAVDPSGQGKSVLVPTINTPIKCGQSVPENAILGPGATTPDPATCNRPVPASLKARQFQIKGKELEHLLAADAKFSALADGKFLAADTYTLDTWWGYAYGATQVTKAGVAAQVSVVVPTYTNVGRPIEFANVMKPAQNACVSTGVNHIRNDSVYGNFDHFIWLDLCGGASVGYDFNDATVRSAYVRNDQWGSPYITQVVDQVNQVGNCFYDEVWNFNSGTYDVIINKCGTGSSRSGYFIEEGFNLTTPTSVCLGALNPYMFQVYKRQGSAWSNFVSSDATLNIGGPCTQGSLPPYFPELTSSNGLSLIIFHQGGS